MKRIYLETYRILCVFVTYNRRHKSFALLENVNVSALLLHNVGWRHWETNKLAKILLLPFNLLNCYLIVNFILPLNRDLSDKNYYKSKWKDLKAKLRTTKEDLQGKAEK